MENVTIKEVAALANVSIATVSRVLNKNYYVSPHLEKRVRDAINELGYYPNSVARSLKSHRTMTIGFLVSDISNNFFTSVSRAVEDSIREFNFHLLVCSTDHKKDREHEYLQLLLEKKVDGIIINTTGYNDEFISAISEKVPIGLLSRRIMTANFTGDLVDSDNIRGSYDLTSHMISLGHRKIGFVNGPIHVSSAIERFEGFQRAMSKIDTETSLQDPYYKEGTFSMISGFHGTRKLMELPVPPTAIIYANNEMAAGGMRYCHKNGLGIPKDVSIASYDRIVNDDLLYVHPSFVTMDPSTIGKKLSDFMIDRIQSKADSNQIANREVRFRAKLVPGNGVRQI